jgi:hypothetical protein
MTTCLTTAYGNTIASLSLMDRSELLSLAFEVLADAVGDLLREGCDPAGYVLTAAEASSPLGEVLQHHPLRRVPGAVCVMLPVESVSRILEAYAFEVSSARRLASWLADAPAPGRYRVVAIGRAGLAAVTVDTTGDDTDDAPISILPN